MPETGLWVLLVGAGLALGAFVTLKIVAIRSAGRLAVRTEDRLASHVGTHLTGVSLMPGTGDLELRASVIRDLDRLARLMDRMIPLPIVGGVGLDAAVGLVPILGDVVGVTTTGFIVVRGAQLGAPPEILSRIIAVGCTDLLLGVVPILGDLADVTYHANRRSVGILREYLES